MNAARLWVSAALLIAAAGLAACQTTQRPGSAASEPRGRVALTFDDAPLGNGAFLTGPERTAHLIAALDEAGVQGAMLFVLTGNIANTAEGAERLKAYADAGFRLANHTHAHPALSKTNVDVYLEGIDEAAAILSAFGGVSPYFRYPYLDEGRTAETRDAVRTALAARGLKNGYVSVDTYDWYMNALAAEAVAKGHPLDMDALGQAYVEILVSDLEFYDTIAQTTLGRSPAHVLLLHENDLAALFAGDLVNELRARGWEVIPAEEAYADPISTAAPDTVFNGQGRVAAIADAKGLFKRSELIAPDEDEDWLRADFIRRGLLPAAE
ncbi:polysaccharide deacetylase family protein [Hyphomonas sp.]|uniref:polysaccharide deacetylase family protein n=1 Tax=Hyphomonas sp. TaxID=87 RepID=UPI00391C37C5